MSAVCLLFSTLRYPLHLRLLLSLLDLVQRLIYAYVYVTTTAVAGLKSTRMLLQSRLSRFLVFVDGVACVTAWDTTQEWGAVCSKPHAVCERSLPIYRTVKGPLT